MHLTKDQAQIILMVVLIYLLSWGVYCFSQFW